jgi:putative PIN family toxin of toxin-antitoxin system
MRVVLDTNVIVSALLSPNGAPARTFSLALKRKIEVCVSGEVFAEYEEVLARPHFPWSEEVVADTLASVRQAAAWFATTSRVRQCADPDDDIFLECAEAAQADYLVTGNLRHFPSEWAGTRIVAPAELLRVLAQPQ